MENYEELKQRIYSAKSTMNALLEFVERNPCGEECRKCTKLKIKRASAFSAWLTAGMLISALLSVPFSIYIFTLMLPGGAV